MTIAYADAVDRRDNTERIRWAVSLLLVLVFHFVTALWLLSREAPVEPNKPPPPAALLDLPPLPLPGTGGIPGAPTPPKPAVNQPAPPKPPVQEVKPALPPKPEPIPKLAVPLPVAPKPKPAVPQPQPPKATPLAPPQPPGYAAPILLDPIRVWQLRVRQRLQQFQVYPPEIKSGDIVPPVILRIEINRQGKILSYSIVRTSGYESLDAAALEMARRAKQFPPLPPELPGPKYEFMMTVRFY
jgi:protein TonB